MDRRYSPIEGDFEGTPSKEPANYWHKVLLFILAVLAGIFIYNSLYVVMRLKSNPPPVVMGGELDSDKATLPSREQMARACWEYAREYVQEEYSFGQSLPESPPQGRIKRTGNPSAISADCWPKLRVAWNRQESWMRSYAWNTDWLTNSHRSFQRTLHRILDFLNLAD